MHTVSQSRLILSGAYREDDSTAARCIGIIRRAAAFYLRESVDDRSGDKRNAEILKRSIPMRSPAEIDRIAGFCRANVGLCASEAAQRLTVPVKVVRHACAKHGIRLRAVHKVGKEAA